MSGGGGRAFGLRLRGEGGGGLAQKKMIKLLQTNLNRSRAAHQLLHKTIQEEEIDVVTISKPNKLIATKERWYMDAEKDVAVKVVNKALKVAGYKPRRHFAAIEIGDVKLISCYASPNSPLENFEDLLEELEWEIRNSTGENILLNGDFNAKSHECNSPTEYSRGRTLSEWVASNGLVVQNKGQTPTYVRGASESYIDLTLTSRALSRRVRNWYVNAEENLSDHQNIIFALVHGRPGNENKARRRIEVQGWKYSESRKQQLKEAIQVEFEKLDELNERSGSEALKAACSNTLPPKRTKSRRKPSYWWTGKIAELRRKCLACKRKLTRTRRKNNAEREPLLGRYLDKYKKAKRAIKREIKASKEKAWKMVVEVVEGDLWGDGWSIVTKRTGMRSAAELDPEDRLALAKKLFPADPVTVWIVPTVENVEEFTVDELTRAAAKIKSGKAAGPDGIPPEAIKLAVATDPERMLEIMNGLLRRGEFPTEWKAARLVLIPKPKQESQEAAYRPICLINTISKLYEALIAMRLKRELEEKGGWSEEQYGFREGKSTVDAMIRVKQLAEAANIGTYGKRGSQ
jgi:endonuclease/exonuclease/phosphatase family metal-dependent hydrolase